MRRFFAISAFLLTTAITGTAQAGNGYFLAIQNDTKDAIEMTVLDSAGWYPKQLVNGEKVVPDSIESFYTEDNQAVTDFAQKAWRALWKERVAFIDIQLYSAEKKTKHKVSLHLEGPGYGQDVMMTCDGKELTKSIVPSTGLGPDRKQTRFDIKMGADGKLTCK